MDPGLAFAASQHQGAGLYTPEAKTTGLRTERATEMIR
jgi:hypothetical protein